MVLPSCCGLRLSCGETRLLLSCCIAASNPPQKPRPTDGVPKLGKQGRGSLRAELAAVTSTCFRASPLSPRGATAQWQSQVVTRGGWAS